MMRIIMNLIKGNVVSIIINEKVKSFTQLEANFKSHQSDTFSLRRGEKFAGSYPQIGCAGHESYRIIGHKMEQSVGL